MDILVRQNNVCVCTVDLPSYRASACGKKTRLQWMWSWVDKQTKEGKKANRWQVHVVHHITQPQALQSGMHREYESHPKEEKSALKRCNEFEKDRKNNPASKVQSYPQTSVYAIKLIPLEERAGTRRPFNVLHAKEPFQVPADQVVQL